MDEPLIHLSGVCKHFGGTPALEDVDLDLDAGATVALVGESGSGKSTLLRAVIGLVRIDRGTLAVLGRDPAEPASRSEIRRRTGYVIQDGGLFPHLSAADNATLAARCFGWPQPRIEARLTELAELTRLDPEMLARPPGALSGGQRQRVALIRALFLDPDLLLLDEPLGALDPIIRADLQDQLKGLFETLGKTVLLVTHDLPEAAFFSDDLVLMSGARVVQRGPLASLRERPASRYVERFVDATRGLPA